uniref:Uncharacterized protein n=1 Tax=Glossina pallidipes TaxID=7398 RepID=A0A1A9Z756_GLOPL
MTAFLFVGPLSSTSPPQSGTSSTLVNLDAPTRAESHRNFILKSQTQTKATQIYTTPLALKYLCQDFLESKISTQQTPRYNALFVRPQALHTGSPLALRRQRVVVVVLQFAHEVPALLAALCNDCRDQLNSVLELTLVSREYLVLQAFFSKRSDEIMQGYLNELSKERLKEGYLSNVLRHCDGLSAGLTLKILAT